MLNIPEEIKDLFRADNTRADTARKIKLRFFDKEIKLLFPEDTLFPSDNLFPVDMEPFLTIENNQISTESLNIAESLCVSENVVFGECNSSKLEITVADVTLDLTNKEFMLTIEVGNYELVMGIYRVKSFVRQADRRMRKITAYDRMQYFQKDVTSWYRGLTFPIPLKKFRDSLCKYIGIAQVGIELPLDNMSVTKTIDPQQLFGLDVLRNICEINGCFGTIDKTGRLKYASLGVSSLFPAENLYPADDLFPSELLNAEYLSHYRQSETTYEDYIVYGIDKLQIRQEEGDVGAIYGNGENGYVVQGNFLVYGKSANELLQIAATLYEQISGRIYRPIKVTCAALPWVEVGDGIVCHTTDEIIETYCFKRTIKGIQAMTDTFEADGSQNQEDDFGISTQIIQLEGKTAVIIKNVEEVSVRVTDLKNYTEAQFKITAEEILAEVTRAKGEEAKLSARISITAEEIVAEVKRAKEAESKLSIRADEISLTVTNFKNETNSKFTQTAEQIELKVSKGQVSSQLSVETDKVTISSNRLIVNSTNFQLDGNGNATFSGKVKGASIEGSSVSGGHITGSVIDVGPLYADEDQVQIGDFFVTTDGSNEIESSNGYIKISQGSGPAGTSYGKITVSGAGSETIIRQGAIETSEVFVTGSWWEGWSLTKTMKSVYERIETLEFRLDQMEG